MANRQVCRVGYLQDIDVFQADNLGGLLELRVARKADIESVPSPKAGTVYGDIVFKAGKGWAAWRVTRGSSRFRGRGSSSQEGEEKQNAISFVVPKDRTAIRNMMRLVADDQMIVLFRDSNGNWKLFGTLEEPAYFTFDQDTGIGPANRNEYNCSFYAAGPDNSYFYNGAIATAPAGAAPAIVKKSDGTVLASLSPGQVFTITSGFSFGFRIE